MTEAPHVLSRRRLLRNAAASTAALAVGGPLLAACGGGGDSGTDKVQAESVKLPAFAAAGTASPTLPGDTRGLSPMFASYPASPAASVAKPPLSGDTVTAAANIFVQMPPARGSNPAWQAVEKALGGTVNWTIIPASDYDTKFNTMVAGGQLPDIFQPGAKIDDLPGFLASSCADLTPHLSGEKVKKYPNLAGIPTAAWQTCTSAGKIYGIPVPRGMSGGTGFYRHDLFAKAGVADASAIKDTDQFLSLLKELTAPSAKQWGMVTSTGTVYNMEIFARLFGTPFNWRVDAGSGKFTKAMETPEYREAVAYLVKLRKAGVFYPGSEGFTGQQRDNAFTSGKAAMQYNGLPGFSGPTGARALTKQSVPAADVRPFVPFGAKAVDFLDNIAFSTTYLKKADDAKVEKLLGVANFMAAPFGSKEYQLIYFGVAGTDYKPDAKGNPILTAKGTSDTAVPWKYLAGPSYPIYDPTDPDGARMVYEALKYSLPKGIMDPTTGLYSPTDGKKGLTIGQTVTDALTDIVAGRRPMGDYDKIVSTWRSQGGDQIRKEYQQAYAQAHGKGKGAAK
ncbi:hypothetical protein BIV57_07845 [Mangrovactinospora gilvigrisea]|uniref:ABC transporter substrate-binding protein n=2 Tax=Mangrovactinospora gilvigrisea TaxID=1428644 RepID=A0A1J7C925_9ACTN|nr:hypothetical protein BIV57_07845 [Mangrovactinospora gilvigrisea]